MIGNKVASSQALSNGARKESREVDSLKGDKKRSLWGSQIRSMFLQPYTMVKDHRTSFEVAQVDKVMDGDLDGFIGLLEMAVELKRRLYQRKVSF